MATHIHPGPSLLLFFLEISVFSLPHIFLGTVPRLTLVYMELKRWAACEPVIMQWTKGWRDSDVLWSGGGGGGLSIGWALNIRCSVASPSNSALPAELYLSWLSSSYSSLCLWFSHLTRKMQPKPALSLREEKGIPYVSLLLIKCHFFPCQRWCPLLVGRLAPCCLKGLNKLSSHFHYRCEQNPTLIPFSSFISCQALSHNLASCAEEGPQCHDLVSSLKAINVICQ